MAHNTRQLTTSMVRTGMLVLHQDDAVELVRQALTGRGITPGKDWQVSDASSCWAVQNLPVVQLLVSKDTGRVISQDPPGN